jgi:hypothetical protein
VTDSRKSGDSKAEGPKSESPKSDGGGKSDAAA